MSGTGTVLVAGPATSPQSVRLEIPAPLKYSSSGGSSWPLELVPCLDTGPTRCSRRMGRCRCSPRNLRAHSLSQTRKLHRLSSKLCARALGARTASASGKRRNPRLRTDPETVTTRSGNPGAQGRPGGLHGMGTRPRPHPPTSPTLFPGRSRSSRAGAEIPTHGSGVAGVGAGSPSARDRSAPPPVVVLGPQPAWYDL